MKNYYHTKNNASFGGINKLYLEARKSNPLITLKQVKKWLSGELTYTLHYPIRKTFSRNRILVRGIDDQWEADLVDMREYTKQNNNHNFILTIIDCFSKFSFAVPLINKTGKEIIRAFKNVFVHRKCSTLRTDRGTEFCNVMVKNFLKKEDIIHFTSHDQEVKCAIVERFNRTLKSKMFKYFTSVGTQRYIDELQNFVDSYNSSEHRTIKMRPIDVNKRNENTVFKNIYGVNTYREAIALRNKKPKKSLKPGDKVRRKYTLKPFDKSYYPNYTDQIFTVEKSIKGQKQSVYRLRDCSGNIVQQRFYPQELQKITENLHRIEKVLRTRRVRGIKQYFVKWLNYPPQYNSWIDESEYQDIR